MILLLFYSFLEDISSQQNSWQMQKQSLSCFFFLICVFDLIFPFFHSLSFSFFLLILQLFLTSFPLLFNYLLAVPLTFIFFYCLFFLHSDHSFFIFVSFFLCFECKLLLLLTTDWGCCLLLSVLFLMFDTLVHVLLCLYFHCIWAFHVFFIGTLIFIMSFIRSLSYVAMLPFFSVCFLLLLLV